jgi:hypothetical protein
MTTNAGGEFITRRRGADSTLEGDGLRTTAVRVPEILTQGFPEILAHRVPEILAGLS